MTHAPTVALVALLLSLTGSCIRYSFSGSTLPAHLKSVEIPLVENLSPRVGLEEKLRESVYGAFTALNVLRVTESGGDAALNMKILSYDNVPDEYDAAGNVKTYKAVVTVDVSFRDQKENEILFEDKVVGTAVYDHRVEREEAGMERAVKRVSEIILNNTVSGW